MGREIESMALEKGHKIITTIDNEDDWLRHGKKLPEADVAVEFSMPGTAYGNILRCFDADLPVVSGTTGWTDSLEKVKQACLEGGHTLFYASNFSPGMNMMFELNRKLASMMKNYPHYRILIEEVHHKEKKDAPSGTAITLAGHILEHHPVKDSWVNKPASLPNELEIISIRKDQVPGQHFVKYDADTDSLEIRHVAHSRKAFALGALLAAEWLIGKKGFFGMQDMLGGQA